MRKKQIGFIGFGNMAQAIARGIERSRGTLGAQMCAYNPTVAKITAFGGGVSPCPTAREAAARADYLFLCVKPQMLAEAAAQLRGGLSPGVIIVSILAGVSEQKLRAALQTDRPIVRVMPNTPLLVGCGATAIARPQNIAEEDYAFVKSVFASIGSVYEIAPDRFDEVIPVNGSSPALIYTLAKLVARNAEKNGMDFEQALHMFADTLAGSARMINESGYDIDTLIRMVCSKGGTTLAMLDALDAEDFSGIVGRGLDASVRRAKELGKA